jgi:hypothetical protein
MKRVPPKVRVVYSHESATLLAQAIVREGLRMVAAGAGPSAAPR